jgi:Excalibur calcium-binding domain
MAWRSRRQRLPVAWLRRHQHRVRMAAFAALAALLYRVVQNLSRWPLTVASGMPRQRRTARRARSASPPAERGQPGYHAQRDDDRDGIACEPTPRH